MTPRTAAYQAPLSVEFSRQEHQSGFPSPGDLPDLGIKSRSPTLLADSLPSEPPGKSHQKFKTKQQQQSLNPKGSLDDGWDQLKCAVPKTTIHLEFGSWNSPFLVFSLVLQLVFLQRTSLPKSISRPKGLALREAVPRGPNYLLNGERDISANMASV